jgi:DeoR/GlpR family transcriptional regulator of sugar metabolism
MSNMQFVEERRNAILSRLEQDGRVSVNTLSEEMGVSPVTIRQDLRTLEQSGLLKRTFGGAIRRAAVQSVPELGFHVRLAQNSREKEVIGAAAAQFVENGFSIALDASTTAAAISPFLKQLTELTIVTNSLYIAQSLLDSPHIQVLMPGGRMRRDAISLVGRRELLPNIYLNIGFVGAVGLSELSGVSDVDPDEVMIKQAMLERCVQRIVVADSSKWGRLAPYTVIKVDAITRIITTEKAPADLVAHFQRAGAQVDLVPLKGEKPPQKH